MGLLEQLEEKLKQAIRSRDELNLSVLRMVKSKILLKRTEKGFSGELTDEVVRDVIMAYHKSLQKAIEEYAAFPEEQVRDKVARIRLEMGVLDPWMPKLLDEAATRLLVKEAIATTGAADIKQMGKVMGMVMAGHKGEVDPGLVKKLATEELGGS